MSKVKSLRVVNDGMSAHSALTLWGTIEKFASYSFPKAHAVEYSVISFQSMWLKVHYRAEFYAASMSVLDSEKLPSIVRDAREDGINVLPPDINISQSSVFEPRQDQGGNWVLYTPFNRLKGLSDKTGDAIVEARQRAGGQFESVEQLAELVQKRRCNARHMAILDEVGVLASLQPGAIPSTDPQRLKKQIELMPGVVIDTLVSNRVLSRDPQVKRELTEKVTQPIFGCADPSDPTRWLTEPCKRCALAGNTHVPSRHGQTARVMIVSQHPAYGEADRGKMAEGLGSETLCGAIERAGMSVSDFYFTNLVKARPDKGQKLDNSIINACAGYLTTEIELLKPTVIVALGSVVIRHLIKGVKGGMNELLGHVEFMPDLDASIVCGPNPSAVHFHPEIQDDVDKLLMKVAEMAGIKQDDEPEPSCLTDEEE